MVIAHNKKHETLLAELEIHKEEFSALQERIRHWEDSERQFLNLSILAAGAGVGFSQIITEPRTLIVLLLSPLVFHVFFREMLDCTSHVSSTSTYLIEILIPRINQILDQLGAGKDRPIALGWQYRDSSGPFNLFYFIIQPMRYWIPVSAIIALLLLYMAMASAYKFTPPIGHIVLILLNVIYLFSTITWGVRSYQKYQRSSTELQRQIEKVNK